MEFSLSWLAEYVELPLRGGGALPTGAAGHRPAENRVHRGVVPVLGGLVAATAFRAARLNQY